MRFGPDPDYREPEPEWKIPPIQAGPRKPFFTVIRKEAPMSWSLAVPEIKNVTAKEAHDLVEKNTAPQWIRDYVAAGINGLVMKFGRDVKVTVTGHGHLCDGPSNYEVTTATIEVRKGE
jgi:hypothetical protein